MHSRTTTMPGSTSKLELRWSPQQIASWLVLEFPDDTEMRVSHETIYLSLFVQSRGALRKELTRDLRMKRRVRRPGGKPPNTGQSHIPAMVNIAERPAEADDRAVPGHGQGDLLYGQGPGVVATLWSHQKIPRNGSVTPTFR